MVTLSFFKFYPGAFEIAENELLETRILPPKGKVVHVRKFSHCRKEIE